MNSTIEQNGEALSCDRNGRHFIAGVWETGDERQRQIFSPATGQRIGAIPLGQKTNVDRAVASARKAAEQLKKTSRQDRAVYLRRVADIIEARSNDLSRLLTLEQGKPIAQSRAEIDLALSALRLSADHIVTITLPAPSLATPTKRAFSELRPKGVYGVITPWNFPFAVPVCYYLGPGLAAGNAIVWVPAPTTSLATVALVECFLEAEPLADGMLNLVLGDGPEVGDALVTHDGVDALAFTGSTATGQTIASRAGPKSLAMELGGNGPTIVFDDADIALAAKKSAVAAFTNAGQICTSTERVLVQYGAYEKYIEHATREAQAMRLGNPFDEETTLGPLHNEATAAKVDAHLADASRSGARVTFGGGRAPDQPTNLYYQPTVIADVGADCLLHCEETFGPVIPVLPFKDDDALQALIKKSRYGLFGSIFSGSIARAVQCASSLKVGVVNINEMSAYWEAGMSGGGASGTLSGTGRFGVGPSILAMSDEVTITFDVS